ncbi:MAG: trypsin-like peptidase domain-containing protein [Polyangiaceae bacterium]
MTNFHVIAGAQSLSVTLYDQKTYEAKVVGAEPRKDIAVLALIGAPKSALKPISVAPSAKQMTHLEVGQKAVAIGNPFGLDHTLTTGIVSALGREVDGVGGVTIRDMIQTDAAINPGNSGGPLLDSSGSLIGMNTMIFSKSGSSAGIGFAVPASTIARVVPQLIERGAVKQVGIGVQIDPQGRLEQRAGLKGVIVLETTKGSPAEKAGLKGVERTRGGLAIGDVIVGVAGKQVEDYDDLYNALDGFEEGAQVKLRVQHGQAVRELEIQLVQVK